MKKLLFIIIIFFSFFFYACSKETEIKLASINLDTSRIDEGIRKDDFKFDLIKVTLHYNSGRTEEKPLEEKYVEGFSYDDLTPGIHSYNVRIDDLSAQLTIKIIDDKKEVFYKVTFLGLNGEIIDIIEVKENEYLDSPIEEKEEDGYIFKGWDYEFPLLVGSDITVSAIYEKDNKLEIVVKYLEEYFSKIDLVSENINLPLSYNGVEISYTSSNEDRLSSSGVYKKDYKTIEVMLTAKLNDGVREITKRYKVMVKGFKSLDKPIASTYLYRNYDKLTNEFYETMDIIYCAFVSIDESGNYKTGSALNNMSKYVVSRAHENGIYVIPSIGGGDSAAANIFSKIASSETTRKNFAQSMVKLINTYGFDGVDIDWEVPKSSEKENFTLLMKELRRAVKANNSNHLVTAAIGGGMWQPPRYDLESSGAYLDYINVMLYSMCSSSGQYQNALFASKNKNDTKNGCGYTLVSCSFEETLKIYNDLGVNNDKLILGLAFYAVKQVKTDGEYKSGGSIFYTNLKANYLSNSNYKYVFDEVAQVPYLISNDGNTFISFDDPRSILAKSAYCIKMGCAGLMTWENGCDLTGELVHAMKEGLGK